MANYFFPGHFISENSNEIICEKKSFNPRILQIFLKIIKGF